MHEQLAGPEFAFPVASPGIDTGSDIDVDLLPTMDAFLQACCLTGVCFVERVGALWHYTFRWWCKWF